MLYSLTVLGQPRGQNSNEYELDPWKWCIPDWRKHSHTKIGLRWEVICGDFRASEIVHARADEVKQKKTPFPENWTRAAKVSARRR